jgi:drug/metabolite transporter (DMT)-like permease
MAWGLLHEALTALALAGLIVASIGCWLVNAGGRSPGRRGTA